MNAMKKPTSPHSNNQGADSSTPEESSAKQKILSTAAKLFAERGFSGVSTRDIAGETGLNISLISYYFNGKEGLYQAVIHEFAHTAKAAMEKMLGEFHHQMQSKEQFRVQMRLLISTFLQMKISSPHISVILMREMIEGLPNAREIHETIFTQLAEAVIQVFESAQKKGYLRQDVNPATLFFSLVHSIDGYIIGVKLNTPLSNRCRQIPAELDLYVNDLMKIFIEGVGE